MPSTRRNPVHADQPEKLNFDFIHSPPVQRPAFAPFIYHNPMSWSALVVWIFEYPTSCSIWVFFSSGHWYIQERRAIRKQHRGRRAATPKHDVARRRMEFSSCSRRHGAPCPYPVSPFPGRVPLQRFTMIAISMWDPLCCSTTSGRTPGHQCMCAGPGTASATSAASVCPPRGVRQHQSPSGEPLISPPQPQHDDVLTLQSCVRERRRALAHTARAVSGPLRPSHNRKMANSVVDKTHLLTAYWSHEGRRVPLYFVDPGHPQNLGSRLGNGAICLWGWQPERAS